MAKNAFPMAPKSGGGLLPKLVGVVSLFAVLTMVVKHPADSAHWAKQTLGLLGAVVDGLATFLQEVLS